MKNGIRLDIGVDYHKVFPGKLPELQGVQAPIDPAGGQ